MNNCKSLHNMVMLGFWVLVLPANTLALNGDPLDFQQDTPINLTLEHGQDLQVKDLDGDGDLDVIVAYSLADQVVAYINGGNSSGGGVGNSWALVEIAAADSIVAMDVAIADFDGQNGLDVAAVGLFGRAEGDGEITWYQNSGNVMTGWTTRQISGNTFLSPIQLDAGDLTGDGRPDLVASSNYEWGGSGVYWFRNDPGTPGNPVSWSTKLTIDDTLLFAEAVSLADVDDDGDLDILTVSRGTDEVLWYENLRQGVDSTPSFSPHVIAAVNAPTFLTIAQLDSDATPEVLVGYNSGQNGGALVFFDATEGQLDQLWTENIIDAGFGGGKLRILAHDFNADEKIDIAATDLDSNAVQIYEREGSGWASPISLPSVPSGINFLAAGDVTGDQKPDLISTTYDYNGSIDRVDLWLNQSTVPTPDPDCSNESGGLVIGPRDFDGSNFILCAATGELSTSGIVRILDSAKVRFTGQSVLLDKGFSVQNNGQFWVTD